MHSISNEQEFWALVNISTPHWTIIEQDKASDTCAEVLYNGKKIRANRLAYLFEHNNYITPYLLIYAICGKPHCCNPEHLVTLTKADYGAIIKEARRVKMSAFTEVKYNKHGRITNLPKI
jgi:hypothetical protein